MCEILHGEGAAHIQHTTNKRHLKPLKLPDSVAEDLEESGGVWSVRGTLPCAPGNLGSPRDLKSLGLAGAVANANGKATKHTAAEAHKPGGALLATSAVPAPTKETTDIELVGTAERAAAAEPEALEPWAGDKAGHGPHTVLQNSMARRQHTVEVLLQNTLTAGARAHDMTARHSK